MIIYKKWHTYNRFRDRYNYKGVFLFGFIPLYIQRTDKI